MNRNDFQELARIRLKEAQVLLKNGNYDGAYYLCGYIIECGLKSCIAKKTREHDFPDKKIVAKSFVHSPTQLIKLSGLETPQKDERKRNQKLAVNWAMVKDWNESSRYEKHSRIDAENLYSAIVNRQDGVLKWIRTYW